MTKQTYYYTNARYEGKTALLAGPFDTAVEAEACIDPCYEFFHEDDPFAQFASYGVVSVNQWSGYGNYNKLLRAAGMLNVPVPEN